jgi:hypothetical protein
LSCRHSQSVNAFEVMAKGNVCPELVEGLPIHGSTSLSRDCRRYHHEQIYYLLIISIAMAG